MKIIVTCSGGKDSVAALLWMRNNDYNNLDVVFCDTGWESPITYQYLEYLQKELDFKLTVLKSKKYDGLVDLAEKKTRFPSKMNAQCNYFKYYIEPYKSDKDGKPKYHTYRRKEILKYHEKYATDVFRPVFDWTAQQVIEYILDNGLKPNPLYRAGMKRVGCFPCIMSGFSEIHQLAERFPERIKEIEEHEKRLGSSFFSSDKIPPRYYAGAHPQITDVVRYANGKYYAGQLFDDNTATSCMSYYGLCE